MIYLAQTDTTAGFLSKNYQEINQIKGRALNTPCLITVSDFANLRKFARVPKSQRNLVRKAKKTTFIYPNLRSIRVVKDCSHAKFLAKFGWLYSSSANLHGQKFDEKIARNLADIVVGDEFFESAPSKIVKLGRKNQKKIR